MLSVHYLGVPAYHYYPAMVFHTSFGWYSLNCLLLVELAAKMVKEQLHQNWVNSKYWSLEITLELVSMKVPELMLADS